MLVRSPVVVVGSLLLAGCVHMNRARTEWTIKTADQAVAAADRICSDAVESHPGVWQAKLENHTWEVSRYGAGGSLDVWIDARDGNTFGCVAKPG